MAKNDFLVMNEMSKQNLDIACALDIVSYDRLPKMKGGTVKIGVASPHFDHLINGAAADKHTHYAVLYIANKEQFDKIKKAPDVTDDDDELLKLKEKARRWDELNEKIDKMYEDNSEADLVDIGEVAASAFGYLDY